jgi:glyoxylase-like metal-dependent hydrolase (beta-lactamase superfamily II)
MRVHEFHPEIWAKAYGLVCEKTNSIILIDPVYDYTEAYQSYLREHSLELQAVIATHTHADHITACFTLKNIHNCDYIMHESTASLGVTLLVDDSTIISFGGHSIRFHHVPGHTNDSMIVDTGEHLFTGDFLFTGEAGVGRDDLPSGRMEHHWTSLSKMKSLNGASMMYTGHEPPHTEMKTLAWNWANNPVLNMLSYEEFEQWQMNTIAKLGSVSKIKTALPANLFGEVPDHIPWLS